jgi:hypothetical protein
VNQQDQQAIEELFKHLYQETAQAGQRDAAADALIQRYVTQAPPGLLYEMAQRLVAQQYTINQLRSQLAAQQQGGAPAGFAPPPGAGYQPGYGPPQYQQPGAYQQRGWQQPGRPGGGFLAGAGKLALGIGGGILGAEVLTSIFDDVGNMFDGGRDDRQYDDGFRDGFTAGDDDGRDQGGYPDQGDGGYDDGGYDNGGFDDGGGGIF